MADPELRKNADAFIDNRFRRSRLVQSGLLAMAVGAAVTAGVTNAEHDGVLGATVATTSVIAAASVFEKRATTRACRHNVRVYANAIGAGAITEATEPVTLRVKDGEIVYEASLDKAASEHTTIGNNIDRQTMRGVSVVSAAATGYYTSRFLHGDLQHSFGAGLGISGVIGGVIAVGAVEVLSNVDSGQLRSAFHRQIENLERGPAFAAEPEQ